VHTNGYGTHVHLQGVVMRIVNWQKAFEACLPPSHQYWVAEFTQFLASHEGKQVIELLAVSNKRIVLVKNAANLDRHDAAAYVLTGSGLCRVDDDASLTSASVLEMYAMLYREGKSYTISNLGRLGDFVVVELNKIIAGILKPRETGSKHTLEWYAENASEIKGNADGTTTFKFDDGSSTTISKDDYEKASKDPEVFV
jgi:hypothetical protein